MEQSNSSLPKRFYVFVFFLLIVCVYLGAMMLFSKPIARYKAKNTDNILQGCLYYTGRNFKGFHMGMINNEYHAPLYDMHITEFLVSEKNKKPMPLNDLIKSNHCYKVKYIIVDFNIFTNHSFLEATTYMIM